MDKSELVYIIRIKTWEDSPKVRSDYEAALNKICRLNFTDALVEDANSVDGGV